MSTTLSNLLDFLSTLCIGSFEGSGGITYLFHLFSFIEDEAS